MLQYILITIIIFGFLISDIPTKLIKMYNCDPVNKTLKKKVSDPSLNKIIVHYKDGTYDITNFVKYHPGGKRVLIENNNKDIEQLMIKNNHSAKAYKILEKYKID